MVNVLILVNLWSVPKFLIILSFLKILNLSQALKDGKSPLQLVQMPSVFVERWFFVNIQILAPWFKLAFQIPRPRWYFWEIPKSREHFHTKVSKEGALLLMVLRKSSEVHDSMWIRWDSDNRRKSSNNTRPPTWSQFSNVREHVWMFKSG